MIDKIKARLEEDLEIVRKATPEKYSRCPHCLTKKPPHWTERSPDGYSCCSECNRESSNFKWVAFTDGITDEQFLIHSRNTYEPMVRALLKAVEAIEAHKKEWGNKYPETADVELYESLNQVARELGIEGEK